MAVAYSGTAAEARTDVRNSLGDISDKWLKDGVIDYHRESVVEPWIDSKITAANYDQDDIDRAIIAYTAEKSYMSMPMKSTVSGGGLTANMAVRQYMDNLRQQTSEALAALDISPPSRGPAPVATRTDGMLRD